MIKIGLIGYGCVGQGFKKILEQKYPELIIEKIAVKDRTKKREQNLPFIYNAEEIIDDPSINLIVEAIDDSSAAYGYAYKIIKQRKSLITANKKMIAENLPLLSGLAQTAGASLNYEGAVCGSIPIIGSIRSYYQSEKIQSIGGIFNGSTNYILTLIAEEGLNYEEALILAQAKGFAESDPTLDVKGFDAANKLSILIYEAFGIYKAPEDIPTTGISEITPESLEKAANEHKKIKLIAKAERKDNKIVAWVQPVAIPPDHSLYTVDYENNSVIIEGSYSGLQQLTGKGAGSLPTGLAVVSDVIKEIARIKNSQPALVL